MPKLPPFDEVSASEPLTLPDLPTMPGTLKSSSRLVASTVQMSPGADCDECHFAVVPSPSALSQAIDHAQATGHRVIVDEIKRTAIEVIS